jgi:hypothetical protein
MRRKRLKVLAETIIELRLPILASQMSQEERLMSFLGCQQNTRDVLVAPIPVLFVAKIVLAFSQVAFHFLWLTG